MTGLDEVADRGDGKKDARERSAGVSLWARDWAPRVPT